MSFKDLVAANPRGLKLSYAMLMTGDPNIYTDGKASWSSFDTARTERAGCLLNREWTFTHKSDPTNPLVTSGGSGPTVRLQDDGTGDIFRTFSAAYQGNWSFLTAELGATAGSTTVTVQDSSLFPVDSYIHLGLEACKVTAAPTSTTLTVARAQLGTLRAKFALTNQTGIRATSSPRVKRGRFVEIWAAPVDGIDKTLDLDSKEMLWVGIIEETDLVDEVVEVQTAPLDKILQTSWPAVLPSGSMYTGETTVEMETERLTLGWVSATTQGVDGTANVEMGTFDETGTFTTLADVGRVSLPFLCKAYQDTINNFFATTTSAPFATGRPYNNSVSIAPFFNGSDWEVRGIFSPGSVDTDIPGLWVGIAWRSGTWTLPGGRDIPGMPVIERQNQLSGYLEVRNPQGTVLGTFAPGTYTITKTAGEIEVVMDNPLYPFEISYENTDNLQQGFAKIEQGGKWELISFGQVTIDANDSRRATLGAVLRGEGGGGAQEWVASAAEEPVKISQLVTISGNEYRDRTLSLDEVLGTLLVSTEDPFQQSAAYDRLSGKGQGLRIPIRYVDTARMRDVGSEGNMLEVGRFWIDEKGKGKEALAEYLKSLGVHLVTRRFQRSGVWYYGLSVDTIDPPIPTALFDVVDDTDRLANSKTRTKNNERLIINSISSKPFLKEWGTKDSNAEPITIFDPWSIEEYGASKALELKPTTLYKFIAISSTGTSYFGREAQLAWMELVGWRWFGAYSRGHYTLEMECPAPSGWRFSMTDRLSVTLTGVRDPEGNLGLVSVPAKITELEHSHGMRAGTKITMRLSYDEFAELAPCLKVVNIVGNVLTVASNHFTESTQTIPHTGLPGAQDGEWFRANDIYEDSITAIIWNEGDYANRESVVISSRSGSSIELDSSLVTASIATNLGLGIDTYVTFDAYDSTPTSPRQNQFAHIASNGSPPTVGGQGAKEYR